MWNLIFWKNVVIISLLSLIKVGAARKEPFHDDLARFCALPTRDKIE
jgi:hypothetical protein